MENQLEQDASTVALQAASALRACAAETADGDAALRESRFEQILIAHEKKLPPQKYPEFYERLSRWFPMVDFESSPGPSTPISTTPSLPHSPAVLISAIRTMLPTLPPKERENLIAKLWEILPSPDGATVKAAIPTGPAVVNLAPQTLRFLGIPVGTPVDANRLLPLVGLFVELLVHFDIAVWDVWKELGSENKGLKRELHMKPALAALLTGQTKLTIPQLTFQIAQLQRLTVELIAQITEVGKYALKHLEPLNPDTLKNATEYERTWSMVSLDARCWVRYKELYEKSAATIQATIGREIAKTVSGAVNAQR